MLTRNPRRPVGPSRRPGRVFAAALAAAAAAASAGCEPLPRQLVIWSPDASRAIVLDPNGVCLCDGDGRLARMNVGTASAAAWLPDSKRALLAVQKSASSWPELAAALDANTISAVIAAAERLDAAIGRVPGTEPLTEEQGKEVFESVFANRGSLTGPAMMYFRDYKPKDAPERFGAARDRLGQMWEKIQDKITVPYWQVGLYNLDGMSLRPGPVVLAWLKGIVELRPSPDGKAAVFVAGSDRPQTEYALYLAALAENAQARPLAEQVAVWPDWSADGQSVAYIRASTRPREDTGNSILLGSLTTRRVAGANGELLAELPDPKDRAGLLFARTHVVRCLANGQILFSCAETTLPATTADMSPRMQIFAFDPARPATLTRMIPKQSEVEVAIFDLSPDQKQISIAGLGTVHVMDLATGNVEAVQSAPSQLRMLPSWRKAGELCFAAAEANGEQQTRIKLALWSAGQTRIINSDWPENVLSIPRAEESIEFVPLTQPAATRPADR